MSNFNFKKYLTEGRIHLSGDVYYFVDVNTEEDEVEVTYNGESYKSALGDELLFIHYFGDGEYHSENDAPEIFKYLKGKGGELEVDDDEATLTIKMSNLEDGEVNTLKEGKLLKENDPFYKSDSYLDDPKPQRLGPSSQFTFEPNDPKKDLMIHTIVDEYQEKIFDYLWNYELYKNEYSKDFGY